MDGAWDFPAGAPARTFSLIALFLSAAALPVPAGVRQEAVSQDETPRQDQAERQLDEAALAQVRTLIRQYFDAVEAGQRKEILENLRTRDFVPRKQLGALEYLVFRMAGEGPRLKAKADGVITLEGGRYPGKVRLSLSGAKKRGAPLFIGLHGGGDGIGSYKLAMQKWGGAPEALGAIAVFPEVPDKVLSAWNKEENERFVLELIRQMKRSFDIDTNRVYLGGHSMGGYGTWSIGGRHADLFASISPCAGGIYGSENRIEPGIVPNVKNTPVYFYHGTNDRAVPPTTDRFAARMLEELKAKYGPYEYVFKEYGGIGHGAPPGGYGPILQWHAKNRREPYPGTVVWEPSREYKTIFYWVKQTGFSGRIAVTLKKNTFEVEGARSGFTLFGNDRMIAPDKPVKVVAEGEVLFLGLVKPSISALVETAAAKEDKEQYFIYRIDL